MLACELAGAQIGHIKSLRLQLGRSERLFVPRGPPRTPLLQMHFRRVRCPHAVRALGSVLFCGGQQASAFPIAVRSHVLATVPRAPRPLARPPVPSTGAESLLTRPLAARRVPRTFVSAPRSCVVEVARPGGGRSAELQQLRQQSTQGVFCARHYFFIATK